jgi:hypothetical protein
VWRPATRADTPEDIVEGQVCKRAGLRRGRFADIRRAISVAHTQRSPAQPHPDRGDAL